MRSTFEEQVAAALVKIREAREGIAAGAGPSEAASLGELLFESADLLVAGIRVEAAKKATAELAREKTARLAVEKRAAELQAAINNRSEEQAQLEEKCATLQRQLDSTSEQLNASRLREQHVRQELERLQEIIAGALVWFPPCKWAAHARAAQS